MASERGTLVTLLLFIYFTVKIIVCLRCYENKEVLIRKFVLARKLLIIMRQSKIINGAHTENRADEFK